MIDNEAFIKTILWSANDAVDCLSSVKKECEGTFASEKYLLEKLDTARCLIEACIMYVNNFESTDGKSE